LKKLYSLADPLIQKLPGTSLDEKRVVFNTIVIFAIFAIYISPIPQFTIINVHTPLGLVGTILLVIVIPILAVEYLLDVYDEYREKIKNLKRKNN